MPMKEGLPASDIDRMVAAARVAIGVAMEARYEATEDVLRSEAGNKAKKALRVLSALHTLDSAFPREVSAAARRTRKAREAKERRAAQSSQSSQSSQSIQSVHDALPDNVDTPETRALLSALDALLPLAEAVDKQRGLTRSESIPTAPGETQGTDFTESVGELVLRLRGEVYGAKPGRE